MVTLHGRLFHSFPDRCRPHTSIVIRSERPRCKSPREGQEACDFAWQWAGARKQMPSVRPMVLAGGMGARCQLVVFWQQHGRHGPICLCNDPELLPCGGVVNGEEPGSLNEGSVVCLPVVSANVAPITSAVPLHTGHYFVRRQLARDIGRRIQVAERKASGCLIFVLCLSHIQFLADAQRFLREAFLSLFPLVRTRGGWPALASP